MSAVPAQSQRARRPMLRMATLTSVASMAVALVTVAATPFATAAEPLGDPISLVTLTTEGVQWSEYATGTSISDNGRVIAWTSTDGDGDAPGLAWVRNMVTGVTERADIDPNGMPTRVEGQVRLSGDGRWLTFVAAAGIEGRDRAIYLRDLQNRTTQRIAVSPYDPTGSRASNGGISDDGRWIAFTGRQPDGSGDWRYGLWLYDRLSGDVRALTPTAPDQNISSVSLSGDGHTVAYMSWDPGKFLDIFIHDVATGSTRLVRPSSGFAMDWYLDITPSSLSDDGRYLAFSSGLGNWVAGDTNGTWDVFVADLQTDTFERVSMASTGAQANGYEPSISGDGRQVAFTSAYGQVVPNDTNNVRDIFVRDRIADTVRRITVGPRGEQALANSESPVVAGNGGHVVFYSGAQELVYGDANSRWDLMLATLPSSSSPSLVAQGANGEVALDWVNPNSDFSRVVVRAAPGIYAPGTPTEGTAVYSGAGSSATASNLKNGQKYSFAVFTKDASGGVLSRKVATASPTAPKRATLGITVSANEVRAGSPVTIKGRLRDARTGSLVSGEPITVFGRRVGTTTWRVRATFRTTRLGYVEFKDRPLRTYEYELRHPETTYQKATSSTVRVRVRR